MPRYEIEVTRGRKLTRDYQSHEAGLTIRATVDLPDPSEDNEPAYDALSHQIQDLFAVAEHELASQVDRLRQAAESESAAPAAAPAPPFRPTLPSPPRNGNGNGHAPPRPAPPAPARPAPPAPPRQGGWNGGGQSNRPSIERLPKTGKQVYPWVMKLQEEYQYPTLLDELVTAAKQAGLPGRTDQWTDEQAAWGGQYVQSLVGGQA